MVYYYSYDLVVTTLDLQVENINLISVPRPTSRLGHQGARGGRIWRLGSESGRLTIQKHGIKGSRRALTCGQSMVEDLRNAARLLGILAWGCSCEVQDVICMQVCLSLTNASIAERLGS